MPVPLKSSSRNGQIRLLQIVENLNTGAVENWLYRMFSADCAKGANYHWTFFCTLGQPGRLDDRVRQLGGEVIYSPYPIGQKRSFFSNLRNVLKKGNYDVIHCHHDFISAMYLCASLGLPIRKRIVHVHNTDESLLTPSMLKQFLFKEPMRQACMHFANNVVGISQEALTKFTHRSLPKKNRDRVIYYGIDTSCFREPVGTREFRQSLGFDSAAKVLLFVGRLVPLKNPLFVVEVLAELVKTEPNAIAVFAGAGALEDRLRQLAQEKGLEKNIRILGWRDDTATIMRLSDVLVFPRWEEPKEGLGLVLVEAQAAGLPILSSPSITQDVQVIPELFDIVPLVAGPLAWAEKLKEMLVRSYPPRQACLARIESSSFSVAASAASLLSLYADVNGHA